MLPVQLPDFNGRPRIAVRGFHPRQRNHLAQYRRLHRGSNLAHLRPPDAHTRAASRHNAADNIQPDQLAPRMRAPLFQHPPPDKIVLRAFERDRKTDARFKRVGLVAKLSAGKNQPRLNPQHIQRRQPQRRQPMRLARLPHRAKNVFRVFRVAKNLVPQFAGIPGAADHASGAVKPAQARDGKPKPPKFVHRRLLRRRPKNLAQNIARARPLHSDVAQLRGRIAHPRVQIFFMRLLPQPQPAVVVAADPAKIVVAQPKNRPVVNHPAVLITHRRIHHLPLRQFFDIAGDAPLHQRLRVRPGHLVFAQRRQIHHRGALAARPILADRAVLRHRLRQPVAVIFNEIAGVLGEATIKSALLGSFHLCLRCFATGDRRLKRFVFAVDPHLNIGRVPAVGRVNVARAGGGNAQQIGVRAQQYIVAGARPRLVQINPVGRINHRVEEEINRRPAAPRAHIVFCHAGVDVVGAVDMTRIAHVLVKSRGASDAKSVVAPASVLHNLN